MFFTRLVVEVNRLQFLRCQRKVINAYIFTRTTLASAGISCRRVTVCLSVRLSQVGVLLKQQNV